MFLNSLSLTNYRQVNHKEYIFSRINIIKGAPDTGKSTILKAIDLLLRNYPGEGYDHFIKVGEKSFNVIGNMMHKSKDIVYDINHERSKTTRRKLQYQDKVYNNSAAVVKMSEIINPVLLEYSSILPQKSKDNVLTKQKAKKVEELKRLFEISNFDIVSSNLKNEATILDQEVKELQKEIDMLQTLTFDLQEEPVLPDIAEVKKRYEELSLQKERYDKEILEYNSYQDKKKEYDKAVSEIISLRKEVADRELLIVLRQSELQEITDFDFDLYYSTKNELDNIEAKQEQHKRDRQIYEAYIKQKKEYTDKIEELTYFKNSLIIKEVTPSSLILGELSINRNEFAIASFELETLNKKLELAESGKCPECGQDYCVDISELKRLIETTTQRKNDLEKLVAVQEKELSDFEAITKENEKTSASITRMDDSISEYTKLLSKLIEVEEPAKIDFTRNTLSLKSKLSKLEEEKKVRNEKEEANKNLADQIHKIGNQVYEDKAKISVLSEIREPPLKEEPDYFDTYFYQQISNQIAVYEEQVKNKERIIEENEKIKKKRNDNDVLITKKNKIKEDKEFDQKVKSDSRKVIDSKLIPELMATGTVFLQGRMNDFFQRNAPEYDIKFDDNMAVWFRIEDTWLPLEHFSGFREDLVRISFMRGVSDIEHSGILLMDEGDGAADVALSTKLFDIILDDPEIEQLFAITHKPETIEYLVNNYGANLIEVGM